VASDDLAVRATHNDPMSIPWLTWGPPVTRWFPADIYSTRWITTTAGQRAVLISNAQQGTVLDFDLENVKRVEMELKSLK
jgi:hypothetical protein